MPETGLTQTHATHASANPKSIKTPKNPLGVMIVGIGRMSKYYFDFCQKSPLTKTIASADINPEALQWAKENYDIPLLTADYHEALKQKDIDVVIVCAPHDLHYPIVMDALNAGKHVICEKPIAISLRQADEMISHAEECDRTLLVALNMRFLHRTIKIKELLDNNKMGKVFMARGAYLGYELDLLSDPNHWKGDIKRAGGGALLDGGYHIIDLMNHFLGAVKSVQALGGRLVVQAQNKGEDNILLLLEYACGAIVTLQISFSACNAGCAFEPTLMLNIEFYGTKGSMQYLYDYDTARIRESLELLKPTEGHETIELTKHTSQDCASHFFDCIYNNTEPIVTALDARNALAVVEAAYKSIKTDRKIPVEWSTKT